MGPSPFPTAGAPPPPMPPPIQPPLIPVGYEQRREPKLRYIILFLLTILTTTFSGQIHFAGFVLGFSNRDLDMSALSLFVHGLWYSLSILAILGAHEFGHYYACRYYRVDA